MATALDESICQDALEANIRLVAAQKETWSELHIEKKLDILDELMDRLQKFSGALQDASVTKRECDKDTKENDNSANYKEGFPTSETPPVYLKDALRAGQWLHSSLLFASWLTSLRDVYQSLQEKGVAPPPLSVTRLPSTGKGNDKDLELVKVQPKGLLLKTLFGGGSSYVVVEGPVEQKSPTKKKAEVIGILGPGNFDAPVDILNALFIENSVCIYKNSPLSGATLPILREILAPLTEKNFVYLAEGNASEGHQLIHHPLVTKWYMTGAVATARSIIWGPRPLTSTEAKPQFTKKCILELGSCTPWIVVPGNWSNRALRWHACHIAMTLTYNGGHICAHPQLIVTCKRWPQRKQFLDLLRRYQEEAVCVNCFYPHSADRLREMHAKLVQEGQLAEEFEVPISAPIYGEGVQEKDGINYIIFATGLPENTFLTTEETFCPVAGEVPLNTAPTLAAFLPHAVDYVNKQIRGTLAVSLSVKTSSQQDTDVVNRAIVELEYGSIVINALAMLGLQYPNHYWGGYGGATYEDLKSGLGYFGNCDGFERPIKSVIWMPFLGFHQIALVPPGRMNGLKLQAVYARMTRALLDRRGSAGYLNLFGNVLGVSTALVACL